MEATVRVGTDGFAGMHTHTRTYVFADTSDAALGHLVQPNSGAFSATDIEEDDWGTGDPFQKVCAPKDCPKIQRFGLLDDWAHANHSCRFVTTDAFLPLVLLQR